MPYNEKFIFTRILWNLLQRFDHKYYNLSYPRCNFNRERVYSSIILKIPAVTSNCNTISFKLSTVSQKNNSRGGHTLLSHHCTSILRKPILKPLSHSSVLQEVERKNIFTFYIGSNPSVYLHQWLVIIGHVQESKVKFLPNETRLEYWLFYEVRCIKNTSPSPLQCSRTKIYLQVLR